MPEKVAKSKKNININPEAKPTNIKIISAQSVRVIITAASNIGFP
jgi:hypothetical protein